MTRATRRVLSANQSTNSTSISTTCDSWGNICISPGAYSFIDMTWLINDHLYFTVFHPRVVCCECGSRQISTIVVVFDIIPINPSSHTHIWTCKEWRWFFYSLCGTSELFVSELLLIFLICLRCFCESQFGEWFYSWKWASWEHARNNEAKNCSSSNGHMRLILKASASSQRA